MPLAMTAHVVYTALDPEQPATTSATVMRDVIRGHIGYDGLVMSDDLSMQALSGSLAERAEAAFAAGCDVALHCNGRIEEMAAVAAGGAEPLGRGPAAGRRRRSAASATSPNRSILWKRAPAWMLRWRWRRRLARIGRVRNMAEPLPFEDIELAERADGEPTLHVDVDGFEGPLDLLLELARRQKVDLHRISILALAEQYLAFIEEARRLRLELAADYLVMAAWLAYLKSRLLLPEPAKGEEPSASDLATALALRLRRLEAIREAARQMTERNRLGRDVFARGAPEPVEIRSEATWEATLYDLLSAYARQRQKQFNSRVTLHKRHVWSLVEAREALERLIGQSPDWVVARRAISLRYIVEPSMRPTVIASALLGDARDGPRRASDVAPGPGVRPALGTVGVAPGRAGRGVRGRVG